MTALISLPQFCIVGILEFYLGTHVTGGGPNNLLYGSVFYSCALMVSLIQESSNDCAILLQIDIRTCLTDRLSG